MSNNLTYTQDGPIIDPARILNGKSEAVIGNNLTYKQERYCYFYTQNEETLLNGVLSYAAAYGFDLDSLSQETVWSEDKKEILQRSPYDLAYHYCGMSASRLMKNDKISSHIKQLFKQSMNDEVVDFELMKIIRKAEKPSDRISAIREYNALNQRITKKLDLTTKGESLNLEDRSKIEKAIENIL